MSIYVLHYSGTFFFCPCAKTGNVNSRIERELKSIIDTEGTNSTVSAGNLRQLIGTQYGIQSYFSEEQDNMELMNMLLQSLALDIQNLIMFSMEEKIDYLYDGKTTPCRNCGCRPARKPDRQNVLQLDIPDVKSPVLLTELLRRYFDVHQIGESEGKRCNVCCIHSSSNHNSEAISVSDPNYRPSAISDDGST